MSLGPRHLGHSPRSVPQGRFGVHQSPSRRRLSWPGLDGLRVEAVACRSYKDSLTECRSCVTAVSLLVNDWMCQTPRWQAPRRPNLNSLSRLPIFISILIPIPTCIFISVPLNLNSTPCSVPKIRSNLMQRCQDDNGCISRYKTPVPPRHCAAPLISPLTAYLPLAVCMPNTKTMGWVLTGSCRLRNPRSKETITQ